MRHDRTAARHRAAPTPADSAPADAARAPAPARSRPATPAVSWAGHRAPVFDTPILRPARAFDAPACAALIDGWIAETAWVPRIHDAATIARHLREEVLPAQSVTVAETGGEIAGFIALGPGGWVSSLYVAGRMRGRGLGATLLGHAKARAGRLHLWTFVANRGARRFYAREGFCEGRRSPGGNAEGLPDVEYVWHAHRAPALPRPFASAPTSGK